ncbi:hypothetical protein E3U55_12375 [Filobacillus milosensis]|uniref:Uncharacterized protein n=1 Tax=Filobacillus milosensis TaxID=94137 RepID=A0A4Y8IF56_9BACI|nr:hypothetical protein [Filobacillus milosensis]TFB15042.1 hypothetical protein E3U55_12375 [Filobacillus milosensis]
MGRLEVLQSLLKSFLYIALAIVLFSNLYEYQPLSPAAKTIIASLAIIEAIGLIRKVDNRNQVNS